MSAPMSTQPAAIRAFRVFEEGKFGAGRYADLPQAFTDLIDAKAVGRMVVDFSLR